jgi:putative oxidoreductase
MAEPVPQTVPRSVVLVRLLVGGVFLVEGILKFVYPADLAAGRFAKIGIPWPEVTGPFVGGLEIVCGALVIAGLATRAASFLLLLDISVALLTTKLPILLGHGFGPIALPKVPRYGLGSMLHEARVDLCMWLGSLFLILAGPGPVSLDARISRLSSENRQPPTR